MVKVYVLDGLNQLPKVHTRSHLSLISNHPYRDDPGACGQPTGYYGPYRDAKLVVLLRRWRMMCKPIGPQRRKQSWAMA
ncbi:hypothetical protein BDN67DRAFT_969845 [Paxillus ammoniavirescens]|nr:hypothetical protein BDN67DRAFT_969845 [Paxillus ammoniavirescens]